MMSRVGAPRTVGVLKRASVSLKPVPTIAMVMRHYLREPGHARSGNGHGSVARGRGSIETAMPERRPARLVTMYVLSLAATIALLVVWVVYIVRSFLRQQALTSRVGIPAERFSWIILSVGCLLLFF